MKKSEMAQNLYFLSILTVITAFTWISLDLYRTIKSTKTTEISTDVIEPLNPEIDTQALERLERRKEFSSSEIVFPSPTPTPIIKITPSPAITPIPSTSASPNPTITPVP